MNECRHDMAPGFQGYSDTRIDMSDVIVWSRRHLICRKCEIVRENDGSEKFSIDWAMALLYSHFR